MAARLQEQFARLTRLLRSLELPQGMTPERLSTLSIVRKRGPISITALADNEGVRPATMSRMVSALFEEGFVKRSADDSDGRGVLVTATPKGRRAFQRAHEQRLHPLAEALSSLTGEQLAAIRNLAAVLEDLCILLNRRH
jgi:DNA-binding MarR family transcriptional regulator